MLIIHKIDWKIIQNRQAVMLGSLGFSYSLISKRTGLSKCQIGYRLKKVGVRLRDYRNGESSVAGSVLVMVRGQMLRHVNRTLRVRGLLNK